MGWIGVGGCDRRIRRFVVRVRACVRACVFSILFFAAWHHAGGVLARTWKYVSVRPVRKRFLPDYWSDWALRNRSVRTVSRTPCVVKPRIG